MQSTPNSNRIHIALFGRTNTGKSSLLNRITGQEVSLVSSQSGTTTDAVKKPMELPGLGACLWTDTAGFLDGSSLGREREAISVKILESTDIALLLCREGDFSWEREWVQRCKKKNIPVIALVAQADLLREEELQALTAKIQEELGLEAIPVSAKEEGLLDRILPALQQAGKAVEKEPSICGHLVKKGDQVLLVMPQDIQAPKGRLILPQVQTLRDLLDLGCLVHCCTFDQYEAALAGLKNPPDLIITDSQVFPQVYQKKPRESRLTSFSVLFSRLKGDAEIFRQGALAFDHLKEGDRILVAEACAHQALHEDIGRVKLPALIQKTIPKRLDISFCNGNDFPEDLKDYALVIHCGACMFNRKQVLSRLQALGEAGVPVTNYGIAIAKLTGILEKIDF